MIESIKEILNASIQQHCFPGCAVAIVVDDKREIITAGHHTYDTDSRIVDQYSVFDVASITKAIPVSCLALKLIENGQLSLNDKMIDFIPEFVGTFREMITIHNLLSQTLDFSFPLSRCKSMAPGEIMALIMNAEFKSEPGQKFCYANATSILLGMVIERCAQKTLEQASREYFFEPLEMNDTTFHPETLQKENVIPTEEDDWRGKIIQGEVHDESAWALRPQIVGSAGLFSTIGNLSNFIEMIIGKGVWRKRRIFKAETVFSMYQNQCAYLPGQSTGLGWELNQLETMGKFSDPQIFGKTGFTGCSLAINPSKNAGYILLSNHIFPKRRENRSCINQIRRSIAAIVLN